MHKVRAETGMRWLEVIGFFRVVNSDNSTILMAYVVDYDYDGALYCGILLLNSAITWTQLILLLIIVVKSVRPSRITCYIF